MPQNLNAEIRRDENTGTWDVPTKVAAPRRLSWWVTGVVVAIVLFVLLRSVGRHGHLEWGTVGTYVFDPLILDGLKTTALLAVAGLAGAILIGIASGLASVSKNPVLRGLGLLYVWVFRSVPTLVQILFWGNITLFVTVIDVGPPGSSDSLLAFRFGGIFTPFVTSAVALAVANGAYFSEIVRTGILSVEDGYVRAAASLGLTWWQRQRRVVLPIALRVMLPPSGSQFIIVLKETTLVSAIGGGDLLSQAEGIYSRTFTVIELLIVVSLWFLLITSCATVLQRWLERRARGSR
ncbi:MAG TPA: amino acid ABC transporter permease [Flexivirga sp.]|uniref:amino acid ABC transporter permease n=1 Tax=Flexivirga sp. TaxID=1962927 RepID=UPI002BB28A33|nr:amino acid ABC transporter permease [Flexivirga sp.]HWC22315.1 amino acid ABC transporter permease [Flexivirga sp.]